MCISVLNTIVKYNKLTKLTPKAKKGKAFVKVTYGTNNFLFNTITKIYYCNACKCLNMGQGWVPLKVM